jgi:hypothetical protein
MLRSIVGVTAPSLFISAAAAAAAAAAAVVLIIMGEGNCETKHYNR